MIKVNFQFVQGNPSGGFAKWKESFLLFDDSISADELTRQIQAFTNDDQCGYRKAISVKDIERI